MRRTRWAIHATAVSLAICLAMSFIAAAGVTASTCGDGAIGAGEECDDANLTGGDCCSPICQFEPGNPACSAAATAEESGSFAGPSQHATVGWEFVVHSDLTVIAVGVFDCDNNGIADSHQVAIWDKAAGPVLIATATVPAGSGAELVDHFRYVTIPALALMAGRTYVIGALYPQSSPDCVVDSGTFAFDPRLAFVTGREIRSSESGLMFPDSPESDRFGPAFLFESLRGNGVVDTGEECDDGAVVSGDGCSADGLVETGYACPGTPSVCASICGDGKIVGAETCDDGDAAGGDGCSGICRIEGDYTCRGAPSVCTNTCGNGVVDGGEFCDDGNRANDDGCAFACTVEDSYACVGAPSVCTTHCGDAVLNALEQCDDGNLRQGDCCSKNCRFLPANVSCRKSMTVPNVGGGRGGAGVTEGWEFTVSSPVTVAGLGVLDDPTSAGLAEAHPVAIWNGSQQLLRSATVPAGTGAVPVGGFRYVPIAALTLTPGTAYVIGAYFPEPRFDAVIGSPTLPLDPRLSLVRGRRQPFVDNLVFPTSLGADPQIGPAFLLEFVGCGNAALDGDEQCDDGNISDGDCCSSTCTITAGPACTRGDACLGDCDHDGQTRAADLSRILSLLNNCGSCAGGTGASTAGCSAIPGADKQCGPGDFNGDGCLSAGEVTRAIANFQAFPLTGCPPAE